MEEKYKLPTAKSTERRLKLDLIHGFGSLCSNGMRDSVSIIEEDNRKILFPMGKYFALKNYYKNDMNFIKLPEHVETILCMTVSPNRKFLAVSERIRNDPVPQISIYNIKTSQTKGEKEKTFRYSDSKSEFVAIAFSHADARFLVCLTGAPDFQLIFLDIARMKPLGYTLLGVPITRLSINPKESHEIGLSGPNCFKLLRVQENSFKNQSEISKLNQNQNFTDHAWFEDQKLIVTNDKGTVYICQKFELLRIIQNGFNETDLGITCLTTFSKGFIIGSDYGTFALWLKGEESDETDINESTEVFILQKKWVAERKSGVCCIDISTNEDAIAVSFKSNDICTYEMSSILPTTAEALELGSSTKFQKEVKFDYLYNGFHNGGVCALDVCLQRPLIATCSKHDSTIRIWNYMNFKCELARKFYVGEESNSGDLNPLLSMAFHPSGYYMAAGFTDKLRFFHVLANELKSYKEITCRQCTQLKFSNGGHLLAAAAPITKSQYVINIYEAFTTEFVINLKGHTGVIQDIMWSPNDQSVFSCGLDGGIYEWKLNKLLEEKLEKSDKLEDQSRREYSLTNAKYTSLMLTYNNMILATGVEAGKNVVREIKGLEYSKSIQLGPTRLVQITAIKSIYNLPGIIAGTEYGQIKVFSSIFSTMPYETIPAHNGEVTKLRTSPDGRYVFSAGEDGSVFIYQVSEISSDGQLISAKEGGEIKEGMDDGKAFNSRALVVDESLGDVVLVPRSDIDNYLSEQKKLKTDLEDLESKMDLKSQDEKRRLEKEKSEAKEKMNLEIQGWSKRYEELKAQKSQIEKESNNLLKNMEATNLKAVEELENLYEKKLAFENEKYLQLKQELSEEVMKYEDKIKVLDNKHQGTIDHLQTDFRDKYTSAQRIYDNTKQTADELKNECEERLAQTEEEHEMEIRQLKDEHKTEIENLRISLANLRSQNEIFRKESKMNNEEKEKMQKTDEERKSEIEKLEQKLAETNKRVEELQNNLDERDETLKKKEKKIYEYKYKINDLQKSKHVLSFRTTEMRKSLEPKEQQIEKLKEELFKLEGEFEGMLKTSQLQNDKIKKMSTQIETLTKGLKNQTEITKLKENLISRITMQIHNCVVSKDPKEWNNEMRTLYQKYVLETEVKQIHQDPKGVEEMNRQIQHLEKSLDQMLESSQKIIKRRGLDIKKKTMENAGLIFDLNEIRKKNKQYEQEITNTATLLEHSKNENAKVKLENMKLKTSLAKHQPIKEESFQEKVSSPGLGPQQGLALQNAGTLQSIQFERKEEKKAQSLAPLSQKQKGEQGNKGKIHKGPNFDSKRLSTFDKAKMMDLMVELENTTQRLMQQDAHIKNLKLKMKKHAMEKGCHDLVPENDNDSLNEIEEFPGPVGISAENFRKKDL